MTRQSNDSKQEIDKYWELLIFLSPDNRAQLEQINQNKDLINILFDLYLNSLLNQMNFEAVFTHADLTNLIVCISKLNEAKVLTTDNLAILLKEKNLENLSKALKILSFDTFKNI